MKQPSKDPFEAAYEEEQDLQEQDSPVESPNVNEDVAGPSSTAVDDDYDNNQNNTLNSNDANRNTSNSSRFAYNPLPTNTSTGKNKDEEEEDEEENMDVELGKFQASGDPDKMAKMQSILSQFTEEQMSRYESFRRSGFQKANMKKLLTSLTGSAKISLPMTIVVSGIAKMFVGELVETGCYTFLTSFIVAARIVMTERRETGPIRPCHIREAYRRLKLEGKVPKRSVPRLFR